MGKSIDIQSEEQKKKIKEMSRAADLWDIIKYTNIYLMGLPEGEERVKRAERMFEEIISESFPNLIKKTTL